MRSINTSSSGDGPFLDGYCGPNSSEWVESLHEIESTLAAVPCLEGAPTPPAPNLGLMEVPALEPMEFLLRLGSMLVYLNL